MILASSVSVHYWIYASDCIFMKRSTLNKDFVFSLFCREDKHRYEEAMHESLEKYMKKLPLLKQQETLKHIYDMYNDPTCIKQNLRYAFHPW